jgi:site-specific DNA-methyltransferase (adenine-specific)
MSEIPDTLSDLRVPVTSLRAYGRNPRRGSVEAIKSSLAINGQYRPIVVNRRTSEVLAGNHTLAAARELGWQDVAATFVDVDEDQAARIVLVDNRSNDVAGYDDGELTALLASLPNLDGTGYEPMDLDALLADAGGASSQDDTAPGDVPEDPRTKLGDLYMLGEHRLLCGDSANPANLDRLYAGVDVGCVLTDPPYGISLDTNYTKRPNRPGRGLLGDQPQRIYRPVAGDDQPFDAAPLSTYFSSVAEQFWFGADYYRRTLSANDGDGSWLVWDKRNEATDITPGSGFELLWSRRPHKRDLLRFFMYGAFGAEASNRVHPTQKPTPLLAEILDRWAPAGCVVADPFLGSGSTLIACEKVGRTCFGLELDAGYCDVIVDRWERHTGLEAERA